MAQSQAKAAAVSSNNKNIVVTNASKYADIIASMEWKDVLLSSIKLHNKWTKLVTFEDNNRSLFKCNLCGIVQHGVKNIYAHVGGKKHKSKMIEVTEVYNPQFTPQTINFKEPLTATTTSTTTTTPPNKETNNSTKSVTKPIPKNSAAVAGNNKKSSSNNNLILLGGNKTGKTTVATPKKLIAGSKNNTSSSRNDDDDIIILPEKSSDAATKPLESSKVSDAPSTQDTDVEIVIENMEVPNPFSQTQNSNDGGAQCKIACVSLSKLIDCKDEENDEDKVETADVIEISDNENDDTATAKTSKQQGDTNANKNKESGGVGVQQEQSQGPQPSSSNIEILTLQRTNIPTPIYKSPNFPRRLSSSFNRVELIFDSDRVDNKMERYGFLGVEYVLKVLKRHDFSAPRYECSLCELVLMGNEMQKHLLGYNHRLKYCQKHFPTAIRQYQQYMSDVPEHEMFKVMTPVLEKLAIAIEKHHGRYAPYKCYNSELESNRHDMFSKVYSRRHASEQHGPTFTHVLDADEIRFLVENRNNFHKQTPTGINQLIDPNQAGGFNDPNYCGYNQPYFQYDMSPFGVGGPSYSQNEGPVLDNETHKMMVENFLKETSRNDPNDSDGRRQNLKRMSSHSSHLERKRSRKSSSSRSERKSLSPLRDGDLWQAYRHMVDIKVYDIEKKYSVYKKDPEQHPRYNDEWQKFWKRRKDELIRSGIDHRLYNYQNEWSIFFKSHMHELYKQNLEEIKVQCRERLYLPMTNDELTDPKYHVVHVEPNELSSDDAFDVELEEDQQNERDRVEHLNRDNTDTITTTDQNKTTPDLIHVLRILAALEEHLGSLGPKITEMLSKALLLTKFSSSGGGGGGLEESFLTRANCIILETCVEKFKGYLYAGLTDPIKRRALNKAIDATDVLLKNVMPKLIEQEKNRAKLSEISRKLIEEEKSKIATIPTTTTRFSPQKRSSLPPVLDIEKSTTPMSSNVSQTQPQQQEQHNNRQETLTSSTPLENDLEEQSETNRHCLTETEKNVLASKLTASLIAKGKGDFSPDQVRKIIDIYFAIINKKNNGPNDESANDSMDDVNQNALFNTIIQSFVKHQAQKPNQMTNQNQQQQQQQQEQYGNMMNRNEDQNQLSSQMTNLNQQQYGNMMNRNENSKQSSSQITNLNQQQYGNMMNRYDNPRTSQMTNQYQQQQQQQFGGYSINRNDNPGNSQMTNQNQQQQQQFGGFNRNRNDNPSNTSQMTNRNQQQQQQQQYFNMNINQNQRTNNEMSNLNPQQLLERLQLFSNMNTNQNSQTTRTNDMITFNQRQQQNASQNNNIMPNNMMNYQQQQQQQSNRNMRSSERGGLAPNLGGSSSNANAAMPNLMGIRNINMNTTSNEQNLRQNNNNVPSLMNNMNNQYPSNNYQSQGFGGMMNRGGGGGGGGGRSTEGFNQQMTSFLNNQNPQNNNSNNNNSNNNWSRMMNSDGGNNQPMNNSNQYRGRNSDNNNMNNSKRQPIWKRN